MIAMSFFRSVLREDKEFGVLKIVAFSGCFGGIPSMKCIQVTKNILRIQPPFGAKTVQRFIQQTSINQQKPVDFSDPALHNEAH